ncbi:uncharacterized protein CTHT_0020430 [Thermochaetoides thermophila DSM 1495]|jgi:hypothetical protein|uniref:Uncharacterized protein n=1 Tax=Chaetomium thermophilum (strain DSM 1495 / CBS 144.50 / IMI 039719) TaxID=759272 RepID=G0S3B6_CHATD|nr:hypothetical protein CTHT_0020430 [Thermochaetoides thermophila DSM 1495]EGS22499.1 hypothetical protein CTHT_0020430 [Thermochaetoides thermophila DSM 1495]
MGNNLSLSEPFADTSGALLSPEDRLNSIILGVAWIGSLYGIGMIWCAVELIKRWAGPHGERDIGPVSICAALLLSTGWPVLILYLMRQER